MAKIPASVTGMRRRCRISDDAPHTRLRYPGSLGSRLEQKSRGHSCPHPEPAGTEGLSQRETSLWSRMPGKAESWEGGQAQSIKKNLPISSPPPQT